MDVPHNVTDDDRKPENAEAALRDRQADEDAETLRVRGRQKPSDPQEPVEQIEALPPASRPAPAPAPTPAPAPAPMPAPTPSTPTPAPAPTPTPTRETA